MKKSHQSYFSPLFSPSHPTEFHLCPAKKKLEIKKFEITFPQRLLFPHCFYKTLPSWNVGHAMVMNTCSCY